MNYDIIFDRCKEETLFGRYITLLEIEPLLIKFKLTNNVSIIGYSVLQKPIYKLEIGTGKIKIFMWSQMHGNESTTTKALFDFLNFLKSKSDFSAKILDAFTFCFLPMVNPDGAFLYTRENANGIDLNRDAQILSQPESKILRQVFDDFKPNFCYNLHDQRSIFGVGNSNKPATVSFLAPSFNENRDVNSTRIKAINVIVAMNAVLQKYLPGQVGRFDDSFNLNCVGDTFQTLNVPTILFEAGHFTNDYNRQLTRKFIFIAMLSGLNYISENDVVSNENSLYLQIPQNKVTFYDIIYKNIKINYDGNEIITNFASQYKEELVDEKLVFNAYFSRIGNLDGFYGHYQYDAQGKLYSDEFKNKPEIGELVNFCLDNHIKIVNGLVKV
ncbi:MAG: peptidase M14 [Flavobacterium sp.]|nr:peptidase M14 [Flavobacterium sp.]